MTLDFGSRLSPQRRAPLPANMADSSRNNLVFFTDEKNRSKVEEYNSKALDAVRGPSRETWADFPGSTRTGPIELRYRGGERLNRLTSLKKEWDPTGVFTNQLLE